MKRNYKINFEQGKRQIELLEKYYQVDKENKVISISLHYQKVSDILDTSIGNNNNYILASDVLEKIDNTIQNIPNNYKVEIVFEIEDYENYNPKDLIESFNDTLELAQYSAYKKRQKKELLCAILVLIGCMLLFFMAFGKGNSWFGKGIEEDIVSEIIDIAAWVFVWEAVSILFLEHSKEIILSLRIRKRVTQIKMFQKGNPNPLAFEKAEAIFGKWENEDKIKRLGKYFLLISSVAFIFTSFYSFYSMYRVLINSEYNPTEKIVSIFGTILFFLITFVAGLGGISKFLDSKNRFSKFVKPYVIALTIIIGVTLIFTIIDGNFKAILSILSSFIINIFYVIGFYIDKYVK